MVQGESVLGGVFVELNNSIVMLISSFAGGMLAAIIGALPALILSGLFIVIGVVITLAGGPADFLNIVGLGPFFGPHISWAAGLAATAYAGRKGLIDNNAITTPLIGLQSVPVILVGGLFGTGAYLVNEILTRFIGAYSIPIAVTVFLSCLVTRIFFSRTKFFGKLERFEQILPKKETLLFYIIISLFFGFLSGLLSLKTGSPLIGFGLALFALIYLQAGQTNFPILHNVAIISGMVAVFTSNLYLAALFGVITMFFQEILANLLMSEADTFWDTWATSIAIMSFIVIPLFA